MVVADEEGTTLVQTFWHDIQNTLFTIARLAARLFRRTPSGCIHTADAVSVRVAGGAWVEVNAAFQQVTVEIRNQGTDIAGGVRALRRFIFFGRI